MNDGRISPLLPEQCTVHKATVRISDEHAPERARILRDVHTATRKKKLDNRFGDVMIRG